MQSHSQTPEILLTPCLTMHAFIIYLFLLVTMYRPFSSVCPRALGALASDAMDLGGTLTGERCGSNLPPKTAPGDTLPYVGDTPERECEEKSVEAASLSRGFNPQTLENHACSSVCHDSALPVSSRTIFEAAECVCVQRWSRIDPGNIKDATWLFCLT